MRNRTLREGFFKNDRLAECPFEARLLFAGLWCFADREGRFPWRPKVIKAEIFPFDTVEINSILDSLLRNNFIRRYEVDGEVYGDIPTFLDHQAIHPHEAKSKIPEYKMSLDVITCNDIAAPCNDMSGRLEVEVQIPLVEVPKKAKKEKPELISIGTYFKIRPSYMQQLISEDGEQVFRDRVDLINDHCANHGTYKDYEAAYRTFRRNAAKFEGRNGNGKISSGKTLLQKILEEEALEEANAKGHHEKIGSDKIVESHVNRVGKF